MNGTVPFASADRDAGVLVGFDGSEPARFALRWAAVAAQSSGSASRSSPCIGSRR